MEVLSQCSNPSAAMPHRLALRSCLVVLALIFLNSQDSARAGEIAAVVEEVTGADGTIGQMDLLEEGQVIRLSKTGKLVLGYFLSCTRETIVGGTVTIGRESSVTAGGTRDLEDVDCDGGNAIRTNNKAQDVAGAVFRKGVDTASLPKPDWTIFGISPILRFSENIKAARIERLDKNEKAIKIEITGRWFDFAQAGLSLKPSGLYVISAGAAVHVLKVSPLAESDVPILSRLIPM